MNKTSHVRIKVHHKAIERFGLTGEGFVIDDIGIGEGIDELSQVVELQGNTAKRQGHVLPRRYNRLPLAQTAGGGGNPQSEAAVEAALKWFVQHQLPDGGWSLDLVSCPACKGQCSHSGEPARSE